MDRPPTDANCNGDKEQFRNTAIFGLSRADEW
jgi:hypothetical protein